MIVISALKLRLPHPQSSRGTLLFLLLVTGIGCLFRFADLARPTLWNDEALTFSRTCGTYDQMLDVLREDGFGPLHYEIDWLLAQRFRMTPIMMRLWPAIAGTLMVPAIYLLGFELQGRRVARTAAILAACSAFLLVYSRDAKMYMPLWLCITLNAGCLLCWMRTGRWAAWLGSVAAGCMATGYHVTGFVVIALDVLIGVTGPDLTWKRTLLIVLGLLLIFAGPVGYICKFNQLKERVDERGWEAAHIDWVGRRTNGHDGSALAADSAGALLFGFSWIDEPQVRVQVPQWIMASAAALLALLAASLLCGAIPWRLNQFEPANSASDLKNWRAALWLSVWILVPAYGFYRATVPIASSWTDWGTSLWGTLTDHYAYILIILGLALAATLTLFSKTRVALILLAAILLIWSVAVPVAQAMLTDDFSTVQPPAWLWVHPLAPVGAGVAILVVAWTSSNRPVRRRFFVAIGIVLIVVIILGLCQAIDSASAGKEVHPVWMPRYLGFICPALIISVAVQLERLPFAPLRQAIFGLLIAVNVCQGAARIFVDTEPPLDKTAADVIDSLDSNGRTLVFTPSPIDVHGPPTAGSMHDYCGEYYLFIKSGKPVTPQEFRSYEVSDVFPLRKQSDPYTIASAVAPETHRIIIWDGLETDEIVPPEEILPRLGKPWKRESQDIYPIRNFWDWGELYQYRRRVYAR